MNQKQLTDEELLHAMNEAERIASRTPADDPFFVVVTDFFACPGDPHQVPVDVRCALWSVNLPPKEVIDSLLEQAQALLVSGWDAMDRRLHPNYILVYARLSLIASARCNLQWLNLPKVEPTLAKLEEHSCEHVRLFDSDVDALVKLWPEEATRILEPWDVVYTLYHNSTYEEGDDHTNCSDDCFICNVDDGAFQAYLDPKTGSESPIR